VAKAHEAFESGRQLEVEGEGFISFAFVSYTASSIPDMYADKNVIIKAGKITRCTLSDVTSSGTPFMIRFEKLAWLRGGGTIGSSGTTSGQTDPVQPTGAPIETLATFGFGGWGVLNGARENISLIFSANIDHDDCMAKAEHAIQSGGLGLVVQGEGVITKSLTVPMCYPDNGPDTCGPTVEVAAVKLLSCSPETPAVYYQMAVER
jgi:hypothetical protein